MIDFLKILVLNTELQERFYNDPRLTFHNYRERLRHFDFETIQARVAKIHKGILFCFYDNKMEILFRPHYYFNENKHNANDFHVKSCILIILEFVNEFDLRPYLNDLKVLNIEIGINAVSPIDVRDLIASTAYHSKNQFVNDDELPFSKKSFSTQSNGKANKYKIIKFYAKGLQYPQYGHPDLFRFEIKSKKSQYINEILKVDAIGSLLLPETYQTFKNVILNEFDRVLILDYTNAGDNLTASEKTKLNYFQNSITWFKSLQGHRNQFAKDRNRYFELLDKTGKNIHRIIREIISQKLDELTNQPEPIQLPDMDSRLSIIVENKSVQDPETANKTGAKLPPPDQDKRGAILPINIMQNCTHSGNRICPVTGISLEHEPKEAKYIRTSTLKHLKRYQPEQYRDIKYILLIHYKKKPKFETDEISHLAKQVRNRYYNPIISKRNHIEVVPDNQTSLQFQD